ncbi:hypothetical protein IE077_001343 [Cardiosporidium cionae]|uniref:SEC63 domain-containing protein n=1 Tax=Cardiosporidium cionae TaxID=476202 RepID=A0ABQ7J5N2_9APIC|nr:hypothetical protein IE077_001343 [Cardiosporidium cionae]|eukprot:KAF8819239.1 hypothetical protein IE077_001343 [Cardiosporidium cionae]
MGISAARVGGISLKDGNFSRELSHLTFEATKMGDAVEKNNLFISIEHNEENLNAELASIIPYPIEEDKMDDPHYKAFLLLQAHMFSLPLPICDYKTDLKSVLDQSIQKNIKKFFYQRKKKKREERGGHAMIDISVDEAHLRYVLHLILLLQCLIQATNPSRSTLHAIAPLIHSHIEELHQNGIVCLPQLLEEEEAKQRLRSLSGIDAELYKEISSYFTIFPLLTVSLTLFMKSEASHGNFVAISPDSSTSTTSQEKIYASYTIPPNSALQMRFQLIYKNSPKTYAAAPHFPKLKRVGWYIVLGDLDESVDELVALRRISFNHRKVNEAINFDGPDECNATFCLTALICSDSYVGLDQQFDIQIRTTH